MINLLRNQRLVLLALAILCFGATGLAVLLGHVFELEACSMCWFQRIAFLLAGAGFLLAAAWPPGGILTRRFGEAGLLLALASSARQSYVIAFPESADTSCGAGLSYYAQIGAWDKFFRAGLMGGSDCAQDQPQFLGLYLPNWSLIAVLGVITLYVAWMIWRRRQA
ncbi:MAG: hypothetical protein CGU28_08620 [Candidatus Dactylopiibacterium carminicum]|uniref:Disulfide bond formation protein B n=1 Tax=Candidatus Dactylopiibacterium carminicum TaxID=857335 RepID=A0A272ES16_9RHOO|nr:disulfide bond formation protein B [Candidatus Dactylopiibacterium carminicum]KAF7598921.1 disulfide bond formation protein B [Candidatus Dactylopiibacterium carminicum]PAS92897.1 MAG: hypothetical protein CGU29_09730 [Candidatus Dactylopiibacterium carminicum]PAS96476.1 MAG: hypothetical protein CGU28_08620 [Candidatus Dactylopiibacterium carminicum]PAS98938.1 MAG: hypothetical protein BSR46_10665 [Candidatus Dactylopiibacterium carminicum]